MMETRRNTDEEMKEVYKIAARFIAGAPRWHDLSPEELAQNEQFKYYCDTHFKLRPYAPLKVRPHAPE